MSTASPLDLAAVGVWTDDYEARVELEHARSYARAINDPRHVDRPGDVVPPLYASLLTRRALHAATARVLPPDLARTALMVHGEHDLELARPLRVGDGVRTRAVALGVRVSSAGTALQFRMQTHDEQGELMSVQFHTSFLPGLTEGTSAGETVPDHRLPPHLALRHPDATSTVRFDADQTYRYADASGDHTAIHIDDAFARSRGLKGIIVHGLCILAVVTGGLVGVLAGGDDLRLRRVAVRFSRNVSAGETLMSRIWSVAGGERRFETTNEAGERVLTHGLVTLAGG